MTNSQTVQISRFVALNSSAHLHALTSLIEKTFFHQLRTDAVGFNFTTVRVNGGGDDQTDPGVEVSSPTCIRSFFVVYFHIKRQISISNIPQEYPSPPQIFTTGGHSVSFTPFRALTFYSTGGSPPFTPDSQTPTNTNEPYLDWLNFILAQSTIPQVITTSYGDDEQSVSVGIASFAISQSEPTSGTQRLRR